MVYAENVGSLPSTALAIPDFYAGQGIFTVKFQQ
jgi:hypothetical protein